MNHSSQCITALLFTTLSCYVNSPEHLLEQRRGSMTLEL